MRVEFINPFLTSTVSVFSQMLSQHLTRETPFVRDGFAPLFDITGIIGLSGKAHGTVAVSMSKETAMAVTETLLEQRCTEINALVTDAVGEVTNMIAGAAKSQMEELNISLGLPTVIVGRAACIAFPSQAKPICIPFTSSLGKLVVEVGIDGR